MPIVDFDYGENVCQVNKVVFGILSPQRIKQKAVCEIYKRITNVRQTEGTLFDPRLGPTDKGVKCPTCLYTYKECPGHFGYLLLAKPVYHPQYYPTIMNLLGCFCNRCSSILVNKYNPQIQEELNNRTGKNRLTYVKDLIRKEGNICPNCGATNPNKFIKDKDGILRIKAVYQKDSQSQPTFAGVNPETVLTIFKNITDEDIELIGLNPQLSRPEWMIVTILPIPPPAMRPSVRADNGKTSEDDLTHKLNDIIKFNSQLREKLHEQDRKLSYIEDYWQVVQYHVATYVDNEISNIPKAQQRTGRPLKTIRQRIKAKEGRVRGNLMGKRVDGSARSVITADPYLSLDQLGVPLKVATNLTYPELVTHYNLSQMIQIVRNGYKKYPGAKHIKSKGATLRKNLKYVSDDERKYIAMKLGPGDIVYRHLMDNDWVLFNRQPSLHKMSMMAHRVKVLEGDTFRLNVNVCAPYNADFDGL